MHFDILLKFLFYRSLNIVSFGRNKSYRENKFHVLVSKAGAETFTPIWKLPHNVLVKIKGKEENRVTISLPQENKSFKLRLNINFAEGSNNSVTVHENCCGNFNLFCFDDGNTVDIGGKTGAIGLTCHLSGNTLQIGKNCMISDNVRIWGDGHAVLDYKTKAVLNKPNFPIIVGNHTWLGERVTLTKGAQIADDTIVALGSIVTKKFEEPHTIIAGSPAKVVKQGVTWDGASPLKYEVKIG